MKKGFTLIELLAVIVILAVISLITIPMIGNIIEDSKKKALEQSVNGIIEAANYFATSNDGSYHFVFSNEEKGVATTGENLSYKGSVDATGNLYIDSDGNISLCLMNENYYVYKNYNSGIYIGNISDDTCIAGYDAITNKYVAMLDDGSGTVSNVYSKEEVDTLVINLQSQIVANDADIEGLNSNLNSLTSIVNSHSTNITNLQNNLANYALQSNLDKTNTKVNANETNIVGLQEAMNEINTKFLNAFQYEYVNITALSTDCNDITAYGFYFANGTAMTNAPVPSPNGFFLVFSNHISDNPSIINENAGILQIYVPYFNEAVYIRTKWYSNDWTEWKILSYN